MSKEIIEEKKKTGLDLKSERVQFVKLYEY